MTKERIEDFREIVLPFVKKSLLEANYENRGKSDAEEFARDFNEILDLAIKALEQEPKTGHWIANAPQYDMLNPQYICSECGNAHTRTTPYCEMCGAKMVEPQESEAADGNND